MCDIKWCKSKKPGTISVNESMDDGSWAVLICDRCAETISIKAGEDLPDPVTVRKRVLNEGHEPEATPERDAWAAHIKTCEKCRGWPIEYCSEGHQLYATMTPNG
ncbi:MAG: putative zinc-finger protein [Siphoviridae sp. ctdEk19]|nr:MAG: putative zinc-finger protein [Siphoviridae sp. ctdEk19]